jgi:DNA-binding response OmpR family regulator
MKLLVVDNDCDMVEMLTAWLKTRGYKVLHALTADRARILWADHQPDLVIMDVGLKDVDALALCGDLRSKHDALILIMSASRDVQTEVHCLSSYADGYLLKPFFPVQLLAHINSLTRRVRSTLAPCPSSILSVGPFQIDSLSNQVTVRGETVRLTPTEGKMLHFLAVNANNVCTLNLIVSHVWGFANSGDTFLVKAHIRHLREKLEEDPSHPQYIITVPSVGYILRRLPEASVAPAMPAETTGEAIDMISGMHASATRGLHPLELLPAPELQLADIMLPG